MNCTSDVPRVALLASDPIRPNMEAFLYNLGRMVEGDFKFDLIVGTKSELRDELPSLMNVYRADVNFQKGIGLRYGFTATNQYLQEHHPDLILNVAQPFPLGVAVVLLAKWHGVPSLLRITGDFLSEASIYNSAIGTARRYIVHNLVLARIYRLADHVVAIGPNLAEGLVRAGFPEAKVFAQYQPFDARTFSPIEDDQQPVLKNDLGLDPSRNTILFVGRFTWGKGADRLAEIVDRVLSETDKYQFCLLGDGPYREALMGHGQEVHAPGFVPRETVHRYFQVADLLVHPSRNEGCPHVILEALACEVPVMASPVGEVDNLVTMVTEEPHVYAEWILEKDWIRDPLPDYFDWSRQSRQYDALLTEAAGYREKDDLTEDHPSAAG
jgi:glycosyltransferase involved in cell wall biosynthesis